MPVLIAYESGVGRARRAADAIADAAGDHGVATLVRSIDDVKQDYVETSDVLIVGCWTPGKVPFGDRPTRRMGRWIESLPRIDGKPVGVYCTYRFFPHTFADTAARTAETLTELGNRLEEKGARVVATRSMNLRAIGRAAVALVDEALEHLS
jgi:flavodoxin